MTARRLPLVLILTSSLLLSGSARAVPLSIILSVEIQGLAPITIVSVGTVSVVGTTLSVAAGAITMATPLVIPVTGSSAITSLSASTLSNLAGTFSAGGVTAQAPGELCGSGPGSRSACNAGGGIGGVMGLTGTINVAVVPNIVVIPLNLSGALLGQGGSTNSPFTFDAAAWTTGRGLVNTANNVVGLTGGITTTFFQQNLSLVTPTFVLALGNLLPIFATLTFSGFALPIPEPTTLLLIGSGLVGLALLRSR